MPSLEVTEIFERLVQRFETDFGPIRINDITEAEVIMTCTQLNELKKRYKFQEKVVP